ncbi:Odorant receptor 68, partial [Frankliniella occidentalis]
MTKLPVFEGLATKALRLLRADLYYCDGANHDDGPLTQHLRWWVQLLDAGELPGRTNYLMALFRQSITSLVIAVAVMVQMIYDTAVTGSMFGFRIGLAVYTTIVVIVLFMQRRRGIKNHLAATAHRCAKLVRFYEAYAWLAQAAIFTALIARNPTWQYHAVAGLEPVLGEHLEVAANMLRLVYLAFQLFTGVCAVVADYMAVVLLLVIYISMGDMYDALGEVLQTRPCDTLLARQQSVLTQASLTVDEAVSDLLPQVLIVSVVVPLLCTVE